MGRTQLAATWITAVATSVLALCAVFALFKFADPLTRAIAENLLASTVRNLEDKRSSLESEVRKLNQINADLEKARVEAHRQIADMQRLAQNLEREVGAKTGQITKLESERDDIVVEVSALQEEKMALIEQLESARTLVMEMRHQLYRHVRSILFQKTALLAGQMYDVRYYDALYRNVPGVIVPKPKPLLSDGGRCFLKFSNNVIVTWHDLMNCVLSDESFPWPPDEGDRDFVQSELKNLEERCPRMNRPIDFTPRPGGNDPAFSEVVSFQHFSNDPGDEIQHKIFCEDLGTK